MLLLISDIGSKLINVGKLLSKKLIYGSTARLCILTVLKANERLENQEHESSPQGLGPRGVPRAYR